MEVKVKKGDMVKKGDVIATFDTSDVEFNIKVKEAEAQKAALERLRLPELIPRTWSG